MTSNIADQRPPLIPTFYKQVAGAAALLVVSVLGGAGLSGLLAGNGFAMPDRLFPTLGRWSRNLGDPASAWTTDPRPGPAWLVYTLVLMIAAALIAGWWWAAVKWRARQLRRQGRRPGIATTADVAGVLDLESAAQHARKLRADAEAAAAIDAHELVTPLGTNKADNKPIALRQNDSLMVYGGSGSGKTWRVALPQILFAPGALALTSTKPDVLEATCLHRARKGRVRVFDPEGIAKGWPDPVRWSPIAGAENPDTAIRRAEGLVAARPMGNGKDSEASAFYAERAMVVIQCYLYAAAVDGRLMQDVRRWSGIANNREVLAILERNLPDWAAEFQQATLSSDPKTNANTMSTVSNILKPLASPKMMAAVNVTARESLDVAEFVNSRDTLYMLSEGGDSSSMAPFVSSLAAEVHYQAKQRALSMPGGRNDPIMRLVLDEVANVAPMPGLADKLTDSGGRGISIMCFAHGYKQLRRRFGDLGAGQIGESASARLILPGFMSTELLDEASSLLGKVEITRPVQVGHNQWRDDRQEKLVMTPEQIRTMPEGDGLLIYRNQPGVILRLRAWWEGDAEQAAIVRESMAYYEKVVATGRIDPPVPAEPVLDQSSATEVGDWVMDFTKGWGK
ncbi:type IV secretory system conjugative DNA transfer family protein [Nocardia farcinica]|uniref:type IV secretory system conjugative DNA transfer family protein n=1 Tax=Nocardia farcinica TaxID=37329 RepID=UPI001893EF19|nr:TraM recognition domain-containing protein [Nocardia farcinica]MBF6388144.1 type IV secretory system conjugative DNA transfer family protein [Nocardia farcinica]UEX26358.1 TraM recognition domain-containing protein [Nocardia farcinica]